MTATVTKAKQRQRYRSARDYADAIRELLEGMRDEGRAQSAAASVLISMVPDPDRPGAKRLHGFRIQGRANPNRSILNASLGPDGVPGIGIGPTTGDPRDDLHIDIGRATELSRLAYGLRGDDITPRFRAEVLLRVCQLPLTQENRETALELFGEYVTSSGDEPEEIDRKHVEPLL